MPTGKGRTDFRWDGDAYKALVSAIARIHGTFTTEQQDAIVKELEDKNFLTSWEGIRLIDTLAPFLQLMVPDNHLFIYLKLLHPTFISSVFSSIPLPFSHTTPQQYQHLFVSLHPRHSRKAYTPSYDLATIIMAAFTKKWDEAMLAHLFVSIYETLDLSFTQENKAAIVTMMKERYGHDVNWNGIRWDQKVHEDVLIAVNVSQLPRADWDRIMATLHGMGYTFSESALRQHLQKLKKKDAGAPAAPATPPSKAAKQKAAPASGRKRGRKPNVDRDDDDDDEKVNLKKPKLRVGWTLPTSASLTEMSRLTPRMARSDLLSTPILHNASFLSLGAAYIAS
ncbi:hypothetical protein O1611_g847 [Lasiodiplodia mahajangana]|uniref:Uncharacterized protein n=1 Tax=Lasiodiplodia mahajangana TaxID=1108764 RepID=A0ACC2JZC6_9PEZI|nr:hypothetical protein O1611_g847 [Lasiodiplodia mahajangana]